MDAVESPLEKKGIAAIILAFHKLANKGISWGGWRRLIHPTGLPLFILMLLVSCSTNDKKIPIDALKAYALEYKVATNSDEMDFELKELPEEVERIVEQRIIDDEYMLYVSLILARHYRSHIMNANQSYIIDKKHPLWKSFEKYSNIRFHSEYELSNVIYYNWLELNEDKLAPILKIEYEAIKKELIRTGNPLSAKER